MLRALVKTCALAGCIVFVPVSMTAQQVVHANPVTVGVSTQDSITISQGLQVGQLVVTEGADKLTDAASVLIANPSDPSAVNKNNTHWYDWRHYL